MFDFIDGYLDEIKKPVYMTFVFIIYIIYLLSYFGIFHLSTDYIRIINFLAQSFVCFILIYRFNPLRKITELRKDDNVIIFGSAMIIFINLVSSELLRLYKENNDVFIELLKKIK